MPNTIEHKMEEIFDVLKPRIGERIYDGAVGSAGFLCEAFEYMKSGNPGNVGLPGSADLPIGGFDTARMRNAANREIGVPGKTNHERS